MKLEMEQDNNFVKENTALSKRLTLGSCLHSNKKACSAAPGLRFARSVGLRPRSHAKLPPTFLLPCKPEGGVRMVLKPSGLLIRAEKTAPICNSMRNKIRIYT